MAFALLAALSWNRWIEPYVDTGRELMVPWRLAHGEKLYRDVHFHHGPLGPYLAAVVDGAAGRSLPARTGLYAFVALLHLAALDRISRRLLSPWRAALATSIAVATAAFLRPGGWFFPFSFDTAIAVAALTWALALVVRAGQPPADIRAGACLLAALLCRPEMGIAGIAVLAMATRAAPRRLVPLAAAPLTAGAAGYGMLSADTPFDQLVSDGWLRILDPPAAFQNVYSAYAGLDRPGLRSAELALAAILLALVGAVVVAAAFAASRLAAKSGPAAAGLEIAAGAALVAAAGICLRPPEALAGRVALLPPLVRVIPPYLVIGAILRLISSVRGRKPGAALSSVPDAVLWMAALFSARLLLAAGYTGPYDAFFLPLPIVVAAAGLLAAASGAAPSVGAALPRMAATALAVFFVFRCASMGELYRRPPWSRVSTPAGGLWLPAPVAAATQGVLEELQRPPAGSTLAGFPETGFFNYVLGLRNPFWLEQFFPGHLDEAGERRAIAVLNRQPPDAILYANVIAVGEGSRIFGRDYLARLDAAVRSRFRPASAFGPGARTGAGIGDSGFFVEILRPERAPH